MIFLILEYILIYIFFLVVLIVLIIYFLILLVNLDEIIGFFDLLDKGIIIMFFGIIGLLLICWIYLGYFLLSNLYELLIFFLWVFLIIYMVFYFNKK